MKISAIIFDVDGVLLDSVPYHFEAWKKMFQEEGYSFTRTDYLEKVNGLPRLVGIKNILSDLTDPEKLNRLAQNKQNYYLEMVKNKPLKPLEGAVAFLKELKKKKIKTAAASSSRNAPALLVTAGLSKYFDAIVGGADFKEPKPHPDIFLTASNLLKVNPREAVVVEDALLGVLAAKAAQMKTVGLLTSDDKNLHKEANIVLKSLKDFEKILQFFSI